MISSLLLDLISLLEKVFLYRLLILADQLREPLSILQSK